MHHLSFHPRLILRTPQEPASAHLDEGLIREYVQSHPPFREALYLASPNLFSAAVSTPDLPEKLLLPLARYMIRSRYRATPFGLFSGVCTVDWGDATRLSLQEKYSRLTRLDMGYLCALARRLESDLRPHLTYYPNSSLYFLGEHIRYVERTGAHVLNSVKKDTYIQAVLDRATPGANFSTLVQTLVEGGVSDDTARTFIGELADTQLLVSELEPTLTGSDFFARILHVADRSGHPSAEILHRVNDKLLQLDNAPELYPEIIGLLLQVGEIPDETRLFHTVRVNACENSARSVHQEYQADILRVIQKLGAFTTEVSPMHDFMTRFYDRYEDQEVPLLTALDTESGIGYHTHTAEDYTPFTEGITLPVDQPARLTWKAGQQTLFRSLQKAQREGLYEIPLPCPETPWDSPKLAPTFAVMFRLVDHHKLLIEHIGGSSATVLAGRFGNASPEVAQILRDIAEEEDRNNPEVIFAEIVHLPEDRTGNILERPAFRRYEIPYLAQSALPRENQLCLRDLYISVRNNRVVLRHGKLNKRVIPRLGSAHNFRNPSLPVYRFLCDLQTQDFQSFADFSWGDIAREFTFLPRVADGRVIVSPATWQLSHRELSSLHELPFDAWRTQYQIPVCFVLAEGDNELFIDSSKPLFRRVFLDAVKGRENVILKEFLGSGPVKNAAGKAMANQFIAFLSRGETVYRYKGEKIAQNQVPRFFGPGSEWLYLKYYCGAKSADFILRQGIAPLLQEAEINGWIDQWFFIRYHDPDNHLRVRFHLTDIRFLQPLLCASERTMQPFVKEGLVWKIQSDTYRRELERYGYEAIRPVERLFHIDSRMYMDFLHQTDGDTREELKWLWGLRNIDRFFHTAGLDIADRKILTEKLRNQFAGEFKMDQHLKSQIDRRYRLCRTRMEEFLHSDSHSPHLPGYYLLQLEQLWQEIRHLAPEDTFDAILTSIVHMSVNRLISSGQRLHELLMYDFLCRHYTSRMAILRAS